MRKMYDNTGLPANPPADCEVTAFYIGGKDVYRVWPQSEIDGIKTRWRLPIWVNDTPGETLAHGLTDGIAASRWAETHGQPKGTCIALDLEMTVSPDYVNGFDSATFQHGYLALAYGSADYVVRNPKPHGGYWVASWDGVASCPKGWAAKQYINDTALGKPWDLSMVADDTPLWDTQKGNEVSAYDLWNYPVAVPEYAKGEHPPGTESIPAAGWLRGAEHQGHLANAKLDALAAQVDALTKLVQGLVKP